MHEHPSWYVPLAPLFASLLAGCNYEGGSGYSNCSTHIVKRELTPDEYAQWSKGMPPESTSGDPTTGDEEGSTTEGSTTDGSVTDGSVTDGSVTDASATDGSTTEGSTTDGSMTDASATEGSATEGSATEGSATEGSTTEGSTTDGSVTDGSVTDASATDGSTTEGSGTGDETPALTPEAICTMICEYHFGSAYACSAEMLPDKVVVRCEVEGSCVVDGRRHAWVVSRVAVDGVDATSWLLRAAHDEAASVHAFRALAGELAAYGAPRELLARIEAAAGDEVRHAAAVTMLARARGVAEVPAPEVATAPIRSLLAIALENAIEGCVHETWAALRAAHQARCAADPVVRRIYASIAADEARHAELAWAIDAWLSRQLDAAGRAEVEAARKAAARALAARLATGDIGPELIALGLPPPHVAARLCVGLNAALWSRAA